MATSKEYIDYVVAQVSTAGVVETKRMFGEYGLYLDGKCVALVCDDTVYVKMLPELSTLRLKQVFPILEQKSIMCFRLNIGSMLS